MKTIAPPHPNPTKPAFVLPVGACDAHCHVFGPAARFPYAANRRYTPPDAPAEKLAALHRHMGISRAVLVQASAHGTDNSAMLDAISRDPANLRGVAMVDAAASDAELERLHAGGVRALRFNFVRHLGGAPDAAAVIRMAHRILPLGWHLVAWVKVSGAERVSTAGGDFSDAIPFAVELIAAASDRVLWGTDWPHPNVREMPDFSPDETLRAKLLVDNPARLYWSR